MEEEGTQLEVSKHLSSAKSQARSQAATVSHQRFTPGNNNTRRLRHSSRTSYHILFSILLICFLPLCSASLLIEDQLVEPPPPTVEHEHVEEESLGSAFDRLAKSGIILVDQSPPPTPLDWTLATLAEDLRRRQVGDVPAATSSKHISSITPTPTSSSGGIATATLTQSMSPLPSPFDGGFSSNITATCSAFMNNMLGNSSFQQCLPFSLLLQNSISFFQAEKSLVRTTQTLDATCAANVTSCTKLMTNLATNLTQNTACGQDFTQQNPLIEEAVLGLLAYKPMYQASCLKNPNTNAYCFADAITNTTNPSDNYIYYLPLNTSLPGGSQPTCNTCLQKTMEIFEAASADRASAIASTYASAAMQVNVNCGPNFVNASLAAPVKAGAPSSLAIPGSTTSLLALLVVVSSWLL